MINIFFPVAYRQRPNRIDTPENEKTEKYHFEWANYCAYQSVMNPKYLEHQRR